MPQHERPRPVAPRPFADEPLGTWLGRVAARYRMAVVQLCDAHALDIDFQGSDLGWRPGSRSKSFSVLRRWRA